MVDRIGNREWGHCQGMRRPSHPVITKVRRYKTSCPQAMTKKKQYVSVPRWKQKHS